MGKIMYRGEQFPGGPNVLSELRDINFSSVQDKQIILYDSTSRTWKNHTITAADVAYDANNSVEDAIDSLNSAIATKADASALPDLKVYQLTANMSAHQGNGNFRVLNMPSNVVPVCIAPWNATDCNWTLFYSSTAHAWFAHASKFTDGSAETSATITTMYIYYVKYTT